MSAKYINVNVEQHISILEGSSCDTEDWRNDAENSPLITGINYSLIYMHLGYLVK